MLESGPFPHSLEELEGLGLGSPQPWFFIGSPQPWLLLWGLGLWTGSLQLDPGFGVFWSGVFDPPLPTHVLLLLVFVLLGSLQHPEPDRSLSLSQPTDPAPFWGSPQWLLAALTQSPPAPHPSLPLLDPQPCCGLGALVQVLDLKEAQVWSVGWNVFTSVGLRQTDVSMSGRKLPVVFVDVVVPRVAHVVAPFVTWAIIPATLPPSSACRDFAVPPRGRSLLSPTRA